MRQHIAPLTGVAAIDGSPAVVSADCVGVVCVWDVRSLTCAQKLNVSIPAGHALTSCALLPRHRQIVAAARRLVAFEGPERPDAGDSPVVTNDDN